MKILKIFAIAAVAMSVAACSDDDNPINTNSGVTVELEQASIVTKEDRGIIEIPLVINGERNGDITVTLGIESSQYENPAVDEKNVYFTTKTVVIFPEDDTYDVELGLYDDDEMNQSRWCDVTIVAVDGGEIGAKNYTTVEIRDNDTEPYDRAAGTWQLITATENDNGTLTETKQYIKLVSYDEGTSGYQNYYQVKDLVSGADLTFRAYYQFDDTDSIGYIQLNNGQQGGSIEIGSYGEQTVTLYQLVAEGGSLYIVDEGATYFHFDGKPRYINSMEVENGVQEGVYPQWGFLFNYGGWYIYDTYIVTGMTR